MSKRLWRSTLWCLFVIGFCQAAGQTVDCPSACMPGRWSTEAADLSSDKTKASYETRDIRIFSPDRKKLVRIFKEGWWVEVEGRKMQAPSKGSVVLYPAELAWAPDSKSFYITKSVGYSTGYETDAYRVGQDQLVPTGRLDRIIRRDFDRRHKCSNGEIGNDPNVVGLKWLGSSERLLLVAEVPPIGICKEPQYFAGYEIEVGSARIVDRYSPQQLMDKWGKTLGERLKGDLEALSPSVRETKP